MIVEDIRHTPPGPYDAKDFNEQESYRLSLRRSDGTPVEVGSYLHWKRRGPHEVEPVDVAIDLSCMSGCTQKCCFCAAATATSTELTADDIVHQAQAALNHLRPSHPEFCLSDGSLPKLTFSFEGMGEPSLVPKTVRDAISKLRDEFASDFAVQFIVSTIAAKPASILQWTDCGLQSLQLSLHGGTQKQRHELLGVNTRIPTILNKLAEFQKQSPDTEIKINYLLISGRNDAPEDADRLAALLKGRNFYLKISRLNLTQPARTKPLHPASDDDLRGFAARLKTQIPAFSDKDAVYIYGSPTQIDMSCGELAHYVNRSIPSNDLARIRDLHEHLLERRVSLFLGAGACDGCWDSKGLAKHLYEGLNRKDRKFDEARDSLQEVVGMYESKGRRADAVEVIVRSLEAAPHPETFEQLSKFFWQSIYTTNYDRFVERAYDVVGDNLATQRCRVVMSVDDFGDPQLHEFVDLIKLHGCVSDPASLIISKMDYTDGYHERRENLFKRLALESWTNVFLFAGYSFSDHEIAQLIYDARGAKSNPKHVYAIAPEDDDTRERLQKFGIDLIQLTFRQVMEELSQMSRQPTVFVVGSNKPHWRKDFRKKITEFADLLGKRLAAEGIRIISGGTALFHAGSLVGGSAYRENRDLVTAYRCHNARSAEGDNVEEIPFSKAYGFTTADVIGRCLRECQFLVFIGGSGITLDEFHHARLANKVVIPILTGDTTYASDMAHTFLMNHKEELEVMGNDRGYQVKQGDAPDRIRFVKDRLESLRLDTPERTVDTILDIIRHYRTIELA